MKFSDREQAFENKFAHDEEVMFKVRARRNKQVGIWAAEKMGKIGDEANKYADNLVVEMLDKEKLYQRLKNDLASAKVQITDSELFKHLEDFVTSARKYFMEKYV